MYDCSFYGFQRAVYLKHCGQCHFVGCHGQENDIVYFLDRNASFIWFDRCMNLNNGGFIYADDPLADGISNGIMVTACCSVFASKEDIRVLGWQSVYINGGGGADLGGASAGVSGIYLNKVMDFTINGMWVASDPSTMSTRAGIHLIDSHSGTISGCSIVNNSIGIRIDGAPSYSTRVTITDNKFEGNALNDLIFISNVKAVKVTNNHFMSTPSRTGTNYEMYAYTGGSDYNIIKHNTFSGASYTILAGSNSIVGDNIFGVPN